MAVVYSLSRIATYALFACFMYWSCVTNSKRNRDVRAGEKMIFIVVAVLWPLTLVPALIYMLAQSFRSNTVDPFAHDPRDPPLAPWKPSKPKGDYNTMMFGEEKAGASEDDMAAFIETLARRPDAPLPNDITFSYKLTGVTRTYAAGTPFPSALVNDWRRGFYMGKHHAEGEEA